MKNNTNSFAIFRFPGEKKIHSIKGICNSKLLPLNKIPDESFLFSPFNKGEKAYHFKFKKIQSLKKELSTIQNFTKTNYKNLGGKHFEELVQKAIIELQKGKNHKIVLANSKSIETKEFNIQNFYKRVEKMYPNAFVYCLSTPITGTWIGASPEPLLRTINGNYQTVSLAGTIANNLNTKWGNKEIIEQEIVSKYIENKLNKAEISFKKTGPFNFSTGILTHLRTEYSFGIKKNSKKIQKLIKLLNPTPAIGGLPKGKAINFITKNEELKRNFYSGFIGTKIEDEYNLFVNLRCLELQENKITLFAGAGITKDSKPKKEWIETQNKMQILESLLN